MQGWMPINNREKTLFFQKKDMPRNPDPVKAAFLEECQRRKIATPHSKSTQDLANILHEHAKKLHKKKGTLGRVARITKKILQEACKKKKIQYKTNDTEDELQRRLKETHCTKKTMDTPMLNINKTAASANDVQKILGLQVGKFVCFKNNKCKQLIKCNTGGFRWKSV